MLPEKKRDLQILTSKIDLPEEELKDGSPVSTSSKEPDDIEN